MTVRHRILLAALAVGVVATLVVLIWSTGPKDATPKLRMSVIIPSNAPAWQLRVCMTNGDSCTVIFYDWRVEYDHAASKPIRGDLPQDLGLGCGESNTIPLGFALSDPVFINGSRRRIACSVMRYTLARKLRLKLQTLPVIGSHIPEHADYEVTSDWLQP